MKKAIKRYVEEEPQKYKVIGYSTEAKEKHTDVLLIDARVTHSTPLDISIFFREMAQVVN